MRKYGDQRFIKDDRSGLLSGWRTGDFVRWDAVELPEGSMDSEFDSGSFAGSFDVSDVMIEVDDCALSTFLMFLFRAFHGETGGSRVLYQCVEVQNY